ncbi:hypothetical protein NA56DRAFT_455261 [Hyaloscypha hepaticicola]|uniref:Uncharacterized protein n=1 Tax=Hyaloscypha hepaticicola TaxID=2082293 RepID=A0A2J6QET8_9HELO|nr:hypothetical protein NA56DRAFT_455261 [Hyaloscypha hepaticicola]
MIGRGWGCTGTSLAPPTTSSTHPQLCIGCSEGRSLAQNTLKKESPGSISAAPDPCFHRPCDCRCASHHLLLLLLLLLLGLAPRSPFEKSCPSILSTHSTGPGHILQTPIV